MGLKEIKEKIKNTPKIWIYLAAALISLLLLIGLRSPAKEKTTEPVPTAPVYEKSYEDELESRLKDMISNIRGAGDAEVMVTLYGGEEKVYAEDISESDGRKDSDTVIIGSKEALLKQTKYPEVKGVLIICPGGDSPQIQEKVVNAVSTVLDIPTSKVYVTKSK